MTNRSLIDPKTLSYSVRSGRPPELCDAAAGDRECRTPAEKRPSLALPKCIAAVDSQPARLKECSHSGLHSPGKPLLVNGTFAEGSDIAPTWRA
jgi:hypothetical protein